MTHEEITTLAQGQFPEAETSTDALFILLTQVASVYLQDLRRDPRAAAEPAPYTGLTPLEALLQGLREILEDGEKS